MVYLGWQAMTMVNRQTDVRISEVCRRNCLITSAVNLTNRHESIDMIMRSSYAPARFS